MEMILKSILVCWSMQGKNMLVEDESRDLSLFMCCLRLLMMKMMMNYFCGMVDRWKAFSLISSRNHCQRSSPSQISNTPWAGFETAQNLSSGFVKWSCAVAITAKSPIHHKQDSNLCRTWVQALLNEVVQ